MSVRTMRRLLVALLLLLGTSAAWGQATYAYRSTTFSWDAVSGAATKVTWDTSCTAYPNSPVWPYRPGDDTFAVVNFPSGFTFTFAGTVYSSVRVLSNGSIQFGTDAGFHRDYTPSALPVTNTPGWYGSCANAVPSEILFVYWRDIDTGRDASSGVFYELKGTAPNRRFVITWNNVYLYGSSTYYNFQVVLNEDGTFKYQYNTGASDGTGAEVGVQVSTSDYTEYSYNQAFIDPTSGTAILWYLSSVAPAQIGEYRFDEAAWSGTAGEVQDSSGTGRNGVRVGSSVQTFTPGKVCRGGNVPNNSSASNQDAIDINQNPAGQIGSEGAITFWYRAKLSWNENRTRMLLDAATNAPAPFFLARRRYSGSRGRLRFVLTDSAGDRQQLETGGYSRNPNTWVHVGITWSLLPGTNLSRMRIYIDGDLAARGQFTSSGSLNPTLASIYMGDNRTSGVTPDSGGSGYSANGDFDEVRVYDFEISSAQVARDMNVTRSNCSPLHHFHIDHYGAGVTCEPESIVISAHDVSENLVTLVGTSITLSTATNHGDWSKITANGTLTNSGNGAGTYVFSGESQITLGLADTYAETTNVNVNAGGITENTGGFANHDPDIAFANAGFAIVTSSLTPATISTKIAGQNSDTGAGAQTLYLQAVKTDLSTLACTSLFPASATPVNVGMAIQCLDPATCQAVSPSITNGAGTTTGGIALNAATATSASASYTTVPLVFGANSMAPFSFNYPDAGQIKLLAAMAIPGGSGTMVGSSNAFVVRPYNFVVSGVAATAAATRPSGGLVRAGEAFSATVTATNLAGAATRNFGCESAAESVTLTPAVSAPAGGNDGSLYRGTITPATFTGLCGSGSAGATDLAWSEVGTLTLTGSVTDNDYLGAGPVVGNASAALGRFYPDHFTLSGSVSAPCGFAYMGQPAIDISAGRLEARSLAGGNPDDQVVSNYRSGYPVSLASVAFVAAESDGIDRAARFSPPPTLSGWTAGVYALSGTGLSFVRAATPDGPYDTLNLGLEVTDGSDNVATVGAGPAMTVAGCATTPLAAYCTARALAAGSPIMVRYGRLRMTNAIGSSKLPLALALEVQYRTASGNYVTNGIDGCTSIGQNRILQGNAQKGLPTLTFTASTDPVAFTAGKATLKIDAPDHEGSRDLSINLSPAAAAVNCIGLSGTTAASGDMSYLRETWCGGSQHDPSARAAFDVYRKDDRFIYQRENY